MLSLKAIALLFLCLAPLPKGYWTNHYDNFTPGQDFSSGKYGFHTIKDGIGEGEEADVA